MRKCLAWVIGAALGAWASAADARWFEAKSRHFIIYGEENPDEMRSYALKLERFDQAVRLARGMDDPPLTDAGRLKVYWLHGADQIGSISGYRGGGILGEYFARASGSYAFVTKIKSDRPNDYTSDIVFFHEYAHHLMLQNGAAPLPLWYSEGFAEFFSTAKVNPDGTVTIGGAANHRAAGVHAFHRDLTLSEVLADNEEYLTGWQLEIIYARGWLLTHYLTFEPSRKGQLQLYLAGIQNGKKPLDSARAAFGDLNRLDNELRRYAFQKEISGIVLHPDPVKIGTVEVRAMSPGGDAMMPVRMRSDFGVSPQTAPIVAATARSRARNYPADAFVQATLAEAEYDADNFDAAEAAADRALTADPQYVPALIYKGRAEMALATKRGGKSDWQSIRNWFVRANRLDTEDAEPLLLFYQSFVDAGEVPTESAKKGLFYALVLAPQDVRTRLLAVRQLLLDRRIAEARQALTPLAYGPHQSRIEQTAREILSAIDSGNSARAVELIDNWKRKRDET